MDKTLCQSEGYVRILMTRVDTRPTVQQCQAPSQSQLL